MCMESVVEAKVEAMVELRLPLAGQNKGGKGGRGQAFFRLP